MADKRRGPPAVVREHRGHGDKFIASRDDEAEAAEFLAKVLAPMVAASREKQGRQCGENGLYLRPWWVPAEQGKCRKVTAVFLCTQDGDASSLP